MPRCPECPDPHHGQDRVLGCTFHWAIGLESLCSQAGEPCEKGGATSGGLDASQNPTACTLAEQDRS